MPAISGIDFYKSLRVRPMLIFTISHGEHALESYELNAVDYLLTPFSFKMDYGLVKMILSDILFVKGLDNYWRIYLQNHRDRCRGNSCGKSLRGATQGARLRQIHFNRILASD
jgi:DNA-binding LytR/AlgR family response regulator